ncbi:sugar/nucleoside kinase (ribokinase family) [Kineococcus radiotolerans]|uniref:Sugar/nucleoside kinase (Ribokinase family) n=1 Tax=Kineococcus radiotolerans TaxID=131568 RepID=A0A7W4XXD7_KINRA|nr:carbohydrate kinase family protein [Kineococcus radiotolerans]MBB2901114.1 sugar/nucleoside kinase (ribokinase family) [Kineococcus radiotolerans]
MTELDLVFGGRVFCDLVMSGVEAPAPGAEVFADGFTVTAGGTATRAVAGARLGFGTALVGAVGADLFGAAVRTQLAAEPRLRLDWLAELPEARTAVTVALTNAAERSFVTYEERATWLTDTLPPSAAGPLPAAAACHVGIAEGVPTWVGDLRRAGTFVVGGVGWDGTGRWDPATLDALADLDAFVPNEDEARLYTRTADADAALEALATRTGLVVVTRGARGAIALDAGTGERCEVLAPPVAALDPTGAGDCFVAALCGARTAGWDLRTGVAFAVLSASLSVQRPGGASSAPTAAELRARVRAGLEHDDLPAGDWDAVLEHLSR